MTTAFILLCKAAFAAGFVDAIVGGGFNKNTFCFNTITTPGGNGHRHPENTRVYRYLFCSRAIRQTCCFQL